ncbi:MAG: AAA family ATPase [Rickettsiales bacterium]|nr:AAA family ATPase [Rickettsiales bacterium]
MTRIISIVNQKGGVGKTTTTVNLATALAAIGQKTLIIDLDPQGNASTGLGVGASQRKLTSYDLFIGGKTVSQTSQKTDIPRLDIIPSNIDLSGAEIELVTMESREHRLRSALAKEVLDYDYVLIDCPPSLGLVTINALAAAQSVFIPLQCEFYALEGLSHLLKTVQLIKRKLNPALDILGIVLTMYDKRNRLTEHVENDVRSVLGDQVCKTVIPRNVRMSEAPSFGKPALVYDINCRGSQAYLRLAREIMRKEDIRLDDHSKSAA